MADGGLYRRTAVPPYRLLRTNTGIACLMSFRVGIDSYCLNPLKLPPDAMLNWVSERGGQGVQFSEIHISTGQTADDGLLREIAAAAKAADLYLEWGGGQHVPFDTDHLAREGPDGGKPSCSGVGCDTWRDRRAVVFGWVLSMDNRGTGYEHDAAGNGSRAAFPTFSF